MSTVFSTMAVLVMPLWFAMIFFPRAQWTVALLRSPLVFLPIALVYAALVLPDIATVLPAVVRPELPQIAELLGTERGATIAWAHFLAFDAFVGRWVWQDARERGISPWMSGPILFLVLMLGPLGLALHLGARSLTKSGARSRSPRTATPTASGGTPESPAARAAAVPPSRSS